MFEVVHPQVGCYAQTLRIGCIFRKDRDAYTGANPQHLPAQFKGLVQ
jgi:hypothetical protein